MKKIYLVFVMILLILPSVLFGQLDGSGIAPNFTLTDINSTSHELYDYLDDGKVVILDFFATWCGPCNNNANAVESVWTQHGTSGDNTIMMFLLESSSSSNLTDLQAFMTSHNVTCPTFNLVETTGVSSLYQITYFPTYYVVYPDRSYKQVSGDPSTIASVMNTAIAENPGLSTSINDARLLEYTSPLGAYCSASVTPKITLQNYGTETLTNIEILMFIDDIAIDTFNWTGSLSQYSIDDIDLPIIESIEDGKHEFKVSLALPNGNQDENILNNSDSAVFFVLSQGQDITIKLKTDDYPSETSWELKKNNDIYATGGKYKNASTLYTENVCVQYDSTYNFTVYDSYGDGMSGFVEIYLNDYKITSFTGFSGFSKSIDFDVKYPTTTITFNPTNESTGVSLDKDIEISFGLPIRLINDDPITDPSSLISFKKNNESGQDVPFSAAINTQKTKITISTNENMDPNQVYYVCMNALAENNYNVPVDKTSITFTTGTIASINSTILNESLTLYPNPAKSFINMDFTLKQSDMVKIEIYNESGQLIQTHNIGNQKSGNNSIKLNITNLSTGIYILNMCAGNESVSRKIQIVK